MKRNRKGLHILIASTAIGLVLSVSPIVEAQSVDNNVSSGNSEIVNYAAENSAIIPNSIEGASVPLKFPYGSTITSDQVLSGVVAYDGNGNVVDNSRLKVTRGKRYSSYNSVTQDYIISLIDSSGNVVVDDYGNPVEVTRKVLFGDDWGELVLKTVEKAYSWFKDVDLKVKHFSFDGNKVTGLSNKSYEVYGNVGTKNSQNVGIPIPPVNINGEIVDTIARGAFPSYKNVMNTNYNPNDVNSYEYEAINIKNIESWGNVRTIENEAFGNNPYHINSIPATWENVEYIGDSVFRYNKDISIPLSFRKVKEIGNYAFYNNFDLNDIASKKIKDWDNIEKIGDSAFSGSHLQKIPEKWPDKLTLIENSVFSNNKIKEVPKSWNNVEQIGDSSFKNNEIKKMPDNWGEITNIGKEAFRNNELGRDGNPETDSNIGIPKDWGKINSVGDFAFADNVLTVLPDIWYDSDRINPGVFKNNSISVLPEWGNNIGVIGYSAFENNNIVKIPDWSQDEETGTTLGNQAFANNDIVEIPKSWGNVVQIYQGVFKNNKIEELPESWGDVFLIGDEAFRNNNISNLPKNWGEKDKPNQRARPQAPFTSGDTGGVSKNGIGIDAFADNPRLLEHEEFKNGDGFVFNVYGDNSFLREDNMINLERSGIPQTADKPIRLYPDNNERNGVKDRETVKVMIVDPKDMPVGGGWVLGDFTYGDGVNIPTTTVTGFTPQGKSKLEAGKTELFLPKKNPDTGETITAVGDRAFDGEGITKIDGDWGSITHIGNSAFSSNKITSVPSSWDNVIEIGGDSFEKNNIVNLPSNWENVQTIKSRAFKDNEIESIPSSWGKIEIIENAVFIENNIENIPLDWGNVKEIRFAAFRNNSIENLPDSWGKVETLGEFVFEQNNIKTINNWEGIKTIEAGAFNENPINSLPEDWGTVEKIDNFHKWDMPVRGYDGDETVEVLIYYPIFGNNKCDIEELEERGCEEGDFTNPTLKNNPDFKNGEGFVFTIKDNSVTNELRDAIAMSGIPTTSDKPITLFTHNFRDPNIPGNSPSINPNKVEDIDTLIINPVDLDTEYFLPHTGGEGNAKLMLLALISLLSALTIAFPSFNRRRNSI